MAGDVLFRLTPNCELGDLRVNSDDETKDASNRTLEGLTPREREILTRRFGIEVGANVTLAEVAKQFDIARDKIREFERRAREKAGGGDEPQGAT
jgi:DNA-directed RNA polymerase sigma subunit (sigma70/sigma32)